LSPLSALDPLPTDALVTRRAPLSKFGGPFCLEIDRGDRDDLRDLGRDIGYRRLIASSPHRLIASSPGVTSVVLTANMSPSPGARMP
jgi:hypothetical protein